MDFLNVSRETMLALANTGAVPGAKIAISWVFKVSDLDDYLTAQIEAQTTARREAAMSGNFCPKVATAAAGVREIKRGRRRELPDLEAFDKAAA